MTATANAYEEMIGYIRTKYCVPDDSKVIIKQGFVTKDFAPKPAKPRRERLLDAQHKRKQELQALTRGAVAKMNALVDGAGTEITRLIKDWESNRQLQSLGPERLYEQISALVDTMYAGLADATRAHMQAVYEKAYARANEALGVSLIGVLPSSAMHMADDELFANVFAALDKAKAKMLGGIYEAIHTPAEEEETQKALWLLIPIIAIVLAVVLSGCDDTKDKIEQTTEDAAARAEAASVRDALEAQGVERYQIVLSSNENACEKCQEMNGQIFAVEDMEIGVNAPPFHPNCGCSIIPYEGEEAEPTIDELEALANSLVMNAVAYSKTDDERKAFASTMLQIGAYYEPVTGVPAVIMAAQACCESGYGSGEVPFYANNLYGVLRGSSDYRNADGIRGAYVFTLRNGETRTATAYDSLLDSIEDWVQLYPIEKWQRHVGETVPEWIHSIAISGYGGTDSAQFYEDTMTSMIYYTFDKWGIYP